MGAANMQSQNAGGGLCSDNTSSSLYESTATADQLKDPFSSGKEYCPKSMWARRLQFRFVAMPRSSSPRSNALIPVPIIYHNVHIPVYECHA
ncbi:hypothetical protein SDJN02_06755 [Cucurbita argyrosperma subsp. argyrosperma]|nr:hypothetical protein SDJN02_06755 [Cucurbita argyrosperma subsp. argyrosperma]